MSTPPEGYIFNPNGVRVRMRVDLFPGRMIYELVVDEGEGWFFEHLADFDGETITLWRGKRKTPEVVIAKGEP